MQQLMDSSKKCKWVGESLGTGSQPTDNQNENPQHQQGTVIEDITASLVCCPVLQSYTIVFNAII
ncbi:hypothetical protein H0H81_012120 [Sphagnurus paluster]|uniref:Uncharacterized protein n=1 Tax=Sphagnurus paluster TaxID=117069 RepID=A0A9P7FQP6_9AGAR|nr:hypothetical protein H0H81_012120 [Sphagnurus paluster]